MISPITCVADSARSIGSSCTIWAWIRSGIVTFTIEGLEAATVQADLGRSGFRLGAPTRTNAQWDIGARDIDAVVRAGVHYFNTRDELDRLVDAVGSIASD